MGIEYELKFAATEQVLELVRRELDGPWQEYVMRTTYYDTTGGVLAARRWTLRRRLENGVSVCTLKTPAGKARREFAVRCGTIEEAIPELCKLGAPAELADLTAGGLVEVCGAAFTRLAATVTLERGTVEVALDKGELFSGGRREPLCELEVELKSGDPAAALELAAGIALRHSLNPEYKSKFKRALALGR